MTALLGLLPAGCFSAPPPPAAPGELGGCHPGAYATLSDLACARDTDCLLCGERLTTRDELQLTNESCPPPADEGASAVCCHGRCVRSLGPPPL